MTSNKPWYHLEDAEQLDSPALIVFPDRVNENIHSLKQMVDDIARLRPHVKTHKSMDITRLLIKAGILKFKCATIAEAEMLGMCDAPDVLLAYQPVGPKLSRFVHLIKKYKSTKYSCLTDNLEAARQMALIFAADDLTVPVYIDLNLGQNRTGIVAGSPAVQLYQECSWLRGIKPVGLHAYDGHIRDLDFSLRKQKCDEAFGWVEQTKAKIVQNGLDAPVVVAGGTPTFSIHCKRKHVECSPGTFIYWDKGYLDLCPEQPFLPAALVMTRVISLPDATKICLDLGHKSIGAENELNKRVYFLNAPGLHAVSQSEEHLVIDAGLNHLYQIGDIFYGLPQHICPTVALYERVQTIENNQLKGEWRNIARDKKINF
jgi:D-threonine aldolase